MGDLEHMEEDRFVFSEKSIRLGFIRKVYAILTAQLVVTFGLVSIFAFVPDVRDYVKGNQAMFWSAFSIMIVCIIVLSCCGEVRRKTPQNFIFLALFTLAESFMLGCVAAYFEAWQVAAAIGATIVATVGLTLFAFQTKWDFTMMGGMLFVSLLILIVFGIFAAIFQSYVLSMLYACLGALIFCLYIVFDTQLMLGGKHKYSISPEEYIFAALNLYLDVVNLFLYLLAIIGGGSRS